jgi:hypothetical protein
MYIAAIREIMIMFYLQKKLSLIYNTQGALCLFGCGRKGLSVVTARDENSQG